MNRLMCDLTKQSSESYVFAINFMKFKHIHAIITGFEICMLIDILLGLYILTSMCILGLIICVCALL